MIKEALKKAFKKTCELEEQRQLKKRSEVAKIAKKSGLNIKYTQCKQIAKIYYSYGMINFLLVKQGETLREYMKRTYNEWKQPYQLN